MVPRDRSQPMTKITIVIPCYNHGHFLLEALASLKECDQSLFTVIIVNDGSTDKDTLTILANLAEQGFLIHHQPNRGLANARNQGISLATTPYILPLDCDNKIRPNYLTRSVAILDDQPTIAVVYSDVHYFGEQDLVWSLPDFDLVHLLVRNYIDACAVFRKSSWAAVGGYDENIPDRLGYEDWDFWLSIASQGGGFYHLPEVAFDYRVRSDSMVQACKIPQNQSRLVEYIATKHRRLYTEYLPQVLGQKELLLFNQINHLENQVKTLKQEVDQLQKTIGWMESSKFWYLRQKWMAIKQTLKIGLIFLFVLQFN